MEGAASIIKPVKLNILNQQSNNTSEEDRDTQRYKRHSDCSPQSHIIYAKEELHCFYTPCSARTQRDVDRQRSGCWHFHLYSELQQ